MKPKKKFKDTVVGKGLVAIAGIVNPSLWRLISGSLNVGEAINHIVKDSSLTAEQREILKNHAHELEIQEFEAEVADRNSARQRQIAAITSGSTDSLFKVVGWGITLSFLGVIYAAIFIDIPEENQRMFDMAFGAVVSAFMSVISYYFGSSKGSKDKTAMLNSKL